MVLSSQDCLKLRALEEMGVDIDTEIDFKPWHPVVDDFMEDPFLANRLDAGSIAMSMVFAR